MISCVRGLMRPVSAHSRPWPSIHISITSPRYYQALITVCNGQVTMWSAGVSGMVFVGTRRERHSPSHLGRVDGLSSPRWGGAYLLKRCGSRGRLLQ